MRNLKVCIAYNGAAYHGFQRQNNAVTVQQTVEEKMSKLLGQPVTINGCSRTDTGVHARQFYFNSKISNTIPCDGFVKGMNSLLPDDIAVLSCEDADEDFHARFCSKGKEYVYIISNTPQRDVFSRNLVLHYPAALDERVMNKAAKLFIGEHDFAAFCKAEAKEHLKSTVRTVYDFNVARDGDKIIFTVSGNGFLHNMVRIMVGTLIYVNEGKRTEDDILRSLETGDRETAGKTIPPEGLYLNKVFYS
ncbi:MAG: tRNA pseudouridine(38-40) synthase TruA [Ruminiclostridium sp.]|nr:tRNA pseudouridine(38-40) synthase TruA [Ruminiclostridium sp.]